MASRIALTGAATCLAIAVLAMAGWIAGIPAFTTFGFAGLATQPSTIIAFTSLALAQVAMPFAPRLVHPLLIGALLVAIAPWLGFWPAATMPITRPTTLIEILLLIGASIPATASGRLPARIALGMATACLLISAVVLTAYLDTVDIGSAGDGRLFVVSFPGNMMALTLSVAIISWRYRDGWPDTFFGRRDEIGRWSLPVLLATLIAMQLGFRALARMGMLDEGIANALLFVVNLSAVTVLVARASARLAESRRERDELVDAIELAAVLVMDDEGIIRHWSRGCQDLYGWSAEEALGRHCVDLLDTDPVEVAKAWARVKADGHWEGELRERHRDGRPLLIHDHAKLFGPIDGRPSAVIVVTDITERRAAEVALQRSEARLRAAIDAQRLTIVEWDLEHRRVDWTTNFDALCGTIPPSTTLQLYRWARAAIAPEDRGGVRADLDAAIAARQSQCQRIIRIMRAPDDIRIVDLAVWIDYAATGVGRILLTCNDVTEHYRREEAIMLGEARLATAVAAQGIFIYEYDLLTNEPIWTTRGESFLGVPVDPLRYADSNGIWDLVPEIGDQVRAAVSGAIARGDNRVHFSFDFHRLDGERRWADSWARILDDDSGQPIRIIGTHLDITERHEREIALRASEAEMRAILATVPDAMVVCDEEGRIRAFSSSAETLFGYAAAEVIGRDVIDLSPHDDRDREEMRAHLFRLLNKTQEADWPMPAQARRADGKYVPASLSIGDALVEGQRMFVMFVRDMRPHIANEEKFHKLHNDLAQVSRLGTMGEMAAALAHELSQPLAAIVNFLGAAELMIEANRDPDRMLFAVRSAAEQASRAGEIIRRLRAFIARGEADMRAEPVGRLIREAAALALFNISSLGVRLTYDFESEHRIILGDRIQIQQVLVNLIRNGVDAMTASGCSQREMLISTRICGDNLLEIEVRDSGPGIAPEILDMLFQPFATTKTEGLGFGLSICRRIIEAHGGQLSADSGGECQGAVFRFTLPIMEQEAQRA